MTENERMVWAAVYASELSRLIFVPQRYCDEDGGAAVVCTAVENANWAVNHMREDAEAVAYAFGECGQVYTRLLEMSEGDKNG